jgi:DNA-binding NarL/FixJ family response regulator
VRLAATILRGIRGFHRRLFMERALLIGDKPLNPVTRRVLQKLLTGISEKEIAESLGQTVPTTHKYVKTIYERFGVNARAALMSLCLRN